MNVEAFAAGFIAGSAMMLAVQLLLAVIEPSFSRRARDRKITRLVQHFERERKEAESRTDAN